MVHEDKQNGWSRWAWVASAVILVCGVIGGSVWGMGRPDWESFWKETRYFWEYKHIASDTVMFGYLPAGFFIFWPFTVWLGPRMGLGLYMILNVGALAGSLWVVYRWWLEGQAARKYFGWLVLLGSVPFAHVLKMNQLTIWVLFLCVSGLMLVGRGRQGWGGVVLGLAGAIKVLPLVLAGYLIFGRKWKALAGMVLALVLFDIIPSALFLGWPGMVAEHRAWLTRAQMRSNDRQIADPFLSGVYRDRGNFSYSSVLSRWLRARPEKVNVQIALLGDPPKDVVARTKRELKANEWLTLDPVPPREGTWERRDVDLKKVPQFHLANFSAGAVWWIWAGSLFLTLGWISVWTWRGRGEDWARMGSVWILAMFFLTPLMMNYYIALEFPGIAVLYDDVLQGVTGWKRTVKVIGLTGWVVGILVMGWRTVRWFGIHEAIFAILMLGIMTGKRERAEKESKEKNIL